MFPWNPTQWTEEFVLGLVGQAESGRLEYKSGRALDGKRERDRFVREHLARTVSGFANSDGGILLLGVQETKGRQPRLASGIDGVSFDDGAAFESLEQFQQVVEACISPSLPGIRIRRVPLSDQDLSRRTVLVIYVPQGTTAYQSKDYIYYRRSEFETKPMADHDVRLRMMRGRTAQARLGLSNVRTLTSLDEREERQATLRAIEASRKGGEITLHGRGIPTREALDAPARTFDEVRFGFQITNCGEVTLRDFLLSIWFETNLDVFQEGQSTDSSDAMSPILPSQAFRYRFERAAIRAPLSPASKIFPGDQINFPVERWCFRKPCRASFDPPRLIVHWTIYLDDGPPSSGELDVVSLTQV